MKIKKVSFFGNFGTQNLGNECTLQAAVYNVRKYLPDVEVSCICSDDQDTRDRHNIPAFPMRTQNARKVKYKWVFNRKTPIIKYLRRIFIRIPMEIFEWVTAFETLKGTDMLVMTGTGMLGDFGIGPFELHYEILKWTTLAKLRRSRILFLCVGGGPIDHRISRLFIKTALSLADYRSYRNYFSKQYMENIGFDTSSDSIYPDLAFSLPTDAMIDPKDTATTKQVIGVGLMEYYGRSCSRLQGETIYQNYMTKLVTFVEWLLRNKYVVRLLIGDVLYDKRVKQDIITSLEQRGVTYEKGQVIDEPVHSVEALVAQIGKTDMLIGTRFHNILLALKLCKPVVAISYHAKIDSLMSDFGLGAYCQNIDDFNADKLIEQFLELRDDGNVVPFLKRKVDEYQTALASQYSLIFNGGGDIDPRGNHE